jgi:hypothetical protein
VTVFGDYEPEDAWDSTDAIYAQIDNLLKRLDALDGVADPATRWRSVLGEIAQRLRPWVERRDSGQLDARSELRVTQLLEDLAFVTDRDDRGE